LNEEGGGGEERGFKDRENRCKGRSADIDGKKEGGSVGSKRKGGVGRRAVRVSEGKSEKVVRKVNDKLSS
jgi:hypothetical protein